MSLSKALSALFSSAEEKTSQVQHSSLASMPTWILALFVAGVLWLTHGVLTDANMQRVFWLALAYIIGEYALRIAIAIVNGTSKRAERLAEINAFTRDNQLTDIEAKVLMQRRSVEKTTETTTSASP